VLTHRGPGNREPAKAKGLPLFESNRSCVSTLKVISAKGKLLPAGSRKGPWMDQRQLWLAWSRGEVSDQQAQHAAELAHSRRRQQAPQVASAFRPRRPQRSPDKEASLARRRRLASSGWAPASIAAAFPTSQAAAMAIIVLHAKQPGGCRLCIDAIAAMAGTCATTVRSAVRAGVRIGLLAKQERRRRGLPSLTNVVRIVAKQLLDWIERRGGGCKFLNTTNTKHSGEESGLQFSSPQNKSTAQNAQLKTRVGSSARPPPP
jgi:hypothetical protein